MNTRFHRSRFAHLTLAAHVAVVLSVPIISLAQTNTVTGYNSLPTNTSGYDNTADGYFTLNLNTSGNGNTAVGVHSTQNNISGGYNTAIGAYSLYSNLLGSNNCAIGTNALYSNLLGSLNSAVGSSALYANTTGNYNAAIGTNALYSNTTGSDNTANGSYALNFNTTGYDNTANGYYALYSNTTGYYNAADGSGALLANSTGVGNSAFGYNSLTSVSTGSYNNGTGYETLYNTTGSFNIDIGNLGGSGDNNTIRIGTSGYHRATYISGISGVTTSGGVAVYINANGQLGTLTSSRRFKNNIKDMGRVSEKLMNLRPVTFRYKDNAEKGAHHLQYGLIAEEVAKVYPDLVQYDKAGKPFTIYYHLLTPMLLNELQKEHHRSQAQKTEIIAMKARYAAQETEIAAMTTAHKAEMTALRSELAALKQTQQQQVKMLAKLAAFSRPSQTGEPLQKAVFVSHR
jgi:hypothetical protein